MTDRLELWPRLQAVNSVNVDKLQQRVLTTQTGKFHLSAFMTYRVSQKSNPLRNIALNFVKC